MAYSATQSINLVRANNQYAHITDTYGLTSWQALTVEAWVRFTTLPASAETYDIITIGWATIGLRVRFENTNGIIQVQAFRHAWSTDTTIISSKVELTAGQWYHVAVSKDASGNTKLYFNGVVVAAASIGTAVGGTVTARSTVGAGYNNGTLGQFPFNGDIALHRVWSVVRTSQEIRTNMCNIFGAATTNMRAEHSFNNVYTDASGNAYTLTAAGTPVPTFTSFIPSICEASMGKPQPNLLRPRIFAPSRAR